MTRRFIYIALLVTLIAGAMTVDTAHLSTRLPQRAPSISTPADTLPPDTLPPAMARQSKKLHPGDLNGDGVLDVMDVNTLCNFVLERDEPIDSAHRACADLVADGVIDVADVNELIMRVLRGENLPPADTTDVPVDTIAPEDWVVTSPARIIPKMMINNARNCVEFANGRILVWDVTPGDSLRLTVDHDNSIGVWMRSYVFYPSADSTTWTQANALAYGDGIKDIAGRKSYEFTVPDSAAVMVCSGFWYENGRVGDGATAASNPFTAYQLERWVDTTGMAPRRQLRVLAVGNSFACDELSYVPYVVQSIAPDVDLHLRILQRPNSEIQEWTENPDSASLDEGNNMVYDWQPFPGRWSLPESGTLRQQVVADQWDVITLQPSSAEPYWDSVAQPLRTITTWLRDSMDYRGRIGWMLSHAYSDSNVVHSTAFPELSTGDEMWELTQALADSVMQSGLVDLLIPSGTAVQNARHTRLDKFTLNHLCAGRWDNGEMGDIHLQEGVGPFVAACAAAGALIDKSPLKARVNLSSTWRIPDADPHYYPPTTNPTLATIDNFLGGLGMDKKSQILGAWCADQAIQRPFELIEDIDDIPTDGWVVTPPARIIPKMMVNNARNSVEFANGRMLVWDVTPGDSLRLTVDHDNSIGVWMRSYVFYSSADSTTWTQANALAYGAGIKDIAGRKSYEFTVPEGAAVMVCSGFWYENGRIGDGASASTNPFTAYQLERWVDTTGMAPRRQLRVLAVGNSFTCDELSYVPYVVQSIAPDVDLHLRILQRPYSGLQGWVENPDSLSLGATANKCYDWLPFPGRWSLPQAGSLRQQVEADQWDVITLQHTSVEPYWDSVAQPLRMLTTWLRDSMDYSGRIGWVLSHAYSDSNVVHSTAFPELTTGDEMWELTQALADSVMQSGLVDMLIPSGTAVQNARRTRLDDFTLNNLCAGRWDNGETGDIHLQEGIGPFVAACAAAGALIDQSPLEARVNLSSAWLIPSAHPSYENVTTNPTLDIINNLLGGLGMEPESQELGAWCADQALQHPFELIEDQRDHSDTITTKDWVITPPARIIKQTIINNARNCVEFNNGRLLVWDVKPGDSLRLTVDHDNSISVWMRSYVFYPSADSTTWTQANALAYGEGIKDIDGRKSYEITVPKRAAVMVCSGYWYENGRIGDGASASKNPFTAYQLERRIDTTGMAPRRQLRVLAIGNSFTCDELSYVPYVIQSIAPDIDLHLRLFRRPTGQLSHWAENPDSVSLGEYPNTVYDWLPFPGRWSLPAGGTLRQQVEADQWDVITFQQVSSQPYWNTVEEPLRTLTTWLRDSMDYHGRIGWVLNHAYSDSNVVHSTAFPELTTSDEMWQLTQALADSVMHSGMVDLLIPSGTAVQNARRTQLDDFTLNNLCAGRWENGETGDIHLQEGIGPFVAACAAAGALIEQSPLEARVNLSSTWIIPSAHPFYENLATNPTLDIIEQSLGGLGMDPESQELGAWCADQALQHPFELIEDQRDHSDTITTRDWVVTPPARIIPKMIINNARNCMEFGNGRMLVWNVKSGESLRLTVDHDNSIGVWMRSYVFYPSADSTTWTQDNALAYGEGIKDIAGRKSYEITVPKRAAVMVCSGYWNEYGRIGDGASASKNPFTAYQLERLIDTTGMAPRRQLRVLAVGNSFTCDELSYVPYIIQSIAPDVDLHMRILQRPNIKLQGWADNPDSFSQGSAFNKCYDWQPFPGRWSLPEVGTLRQQVEADQWDVITFQQVSSKPYWNTVEEPLRTLTSWLCDSMDYHGRIGWVLNHAYSDSNVVHSTAFPELTTSDEMWQLTQALADSVMHSGMVDLLIPSGTAVQNARRTRLDNFTLNHLCAGRWNDEDMGDIHLQVGIGPFVAACAAAGALIDQSPLEAHVNLSSNWMIPCASPSYATLATNPTLDVIEDSLGGLGMDPKSQALGAWCADQALQHPFELIDSMNTDPGGTEDPQPQTAPLMSVQFDGQNLFIASNNGQGSEMCYTFRKCMSNLLFTFSAVGHRPVSRNTSNTSGIADGTNITWLNSANSDNIGPFSVRGYDDFIGGNHTWREIDSQGNLGPFTEIYTATCDSVSIRLDDNLVSAGTSSSGQCVTVDVWNTLMDPRVPPDSGATTLSSPLIAEHAVYTIQKNSITVSMEHHYYKDITVNRYYGMQSMFRNEDYIMTPNGAHLTWTSSENTTSFKKQQYPGFNRFLEYNSSNGWVQSSHLLPDGLGGHESIGNSSYIFVRSGTKDYHVLMDNCSIHSGDTTIWKGVYSWAPLLVNNDILLAYESVIDSHDVIYIDAKSAGIDTLPLPVGWSDFRVISSDDGITLSHENDREIIVNASTTASAIIERLDTTDIK